MQRLSNSQLDNITGGNVWIGLGVVALIIFLAGIIEGYTNPGECNNE